MYIWTVYIYNLNHHVRHFPSTLTFHDYLVVLLRNHIYFPQT